MSQIWDDTLAKTAEQWASTCIWEHGPRNLLRFLGQNLSVRTGRYASSPSFPVYGYFPMVIVHYTNILLGLERARKAFHHTIMRFGAMFGLFTDTGPFCSWWSPGMMKWRTILFPILETAIPDVPLSATGLCALIIHKWVDYDNVCIINFFRYTTVQRFAVHYRFILCVWLLF